MPRKGPAKKRVIAPDPVYGNKMLAKLINRVLMDGKKSIAEKIVYGAMDIIGERTKRNPMEVVEEAFRNVTPIIEVKPRRVGGATYQVPVDVREDRRIALAIRWIKNYASARRDKSMAAKLAAELLAASNGEGSAVKKREDTHRMAEANKAFAHFKW